MTLSSSPSIQKQYQKGSWYDRLVWAPISVVIRFYLIMGKLLTPREAGFYFAAQSFLTMAFSYVSFLLQSQLTRYYTGPATSALYTETENKEPAVETIQSLVLTTHFAAHVVSNAVFFMINNYLSYGMVVYMSQRIQKKLNRLDQDPKLFHHPAYSHQAKTISQVVYPKNAEDFVKGGTEILCEMIKQGGEILFISMILSRDLRIHQRLHELWHPNPASSHAPMNMLPDLAYVLAVVASSLINGALHSRISQEKIAYDDTLNRVKRINHTMEKREQIPQIYHHALYVNSLNDEHQALYENSYRRLRWHALQHGNNEVFDPLMLVARLYTVAYKLHQGQIPSQHIAVYLDLYARITRIGASPTKVAKSRDDFEVSVLQLEKAISLLAQQVEKPAPLLPLNSHPSNAILSNAAYVTIDPAKPTLDPNHAQNNQAKTLSFKKSLTLKGKEYWQILMQGDASGLLLRMLADVSHHGKFNGTIVKRSDLKVYFIDKQPYFSENWTLLQYCGFSPDLTDEDKQAATNALSSDWVEIWAKAQAQAGEQAQQSPRLTDNISSEQHGDMYWQAVIVSATLHRIEHELNKSGPSKQPVLLLLNKSLDLLSVSAKEYFRKKIVSLVKNHNICVLESSNDPNDPLETLTNSLAGGKISLQERGLKITLTPSTSRVPSPSTSPSTSPPTSASSSASCSPVLGPRTDQTALNSDTEGFKQLPHSAEKKEKTLETESSSAKKKTKFVKIETTESEEGPSKKKKRSKKHKNDGLIRVLSNSFFSQAPDNFSDVNISEESSISYPWSSTPAGSRSQKFFIGE
jgi:hypothetical protein